MDDLCFFFHWETVKEKAYGPVSVGSFAVAILNVEL